MTFKRSDLFREYARLIDMCEGTVVSPIDCVRWNGEPCGLNFLEGTYAALDGYSFAKAIVENKPVFIGDMLWRRFNGTRQKMLYSSGTAYEWSWEEPNIYADLIKAQKEGKRVAWKDMGGEWHILSEKELTEANDGLDNFKIVEDKEYTSIICPSWRGDDVTVKLFKDGLSGKISAEVVE